MPDLAVSQVLAPADAAVWARFTAASNVAIAELLPPPPHACTAACQAYTGPVRLGRAGEQITPGRPS